MSYSFVAGKPGTYLYESGSDISKQVEMGLYGALVVRPALGANCAYDASTQFDPTREYLLLLGEIDPDLHHAVETGGTYDFNALHNRYFTINGREFPDTLQDNGSALAAQPSRTGRWCASSRPRPYQPAGAHPHDQRRGAQPPVPPARQPHDARSPRTAGCCSAQAAGALRPSTSARRSAPARPRTTCSAGIPSPRIQPARRSTTTGTPVPTRCRCRSRTTAT